jgi:hypothetical protein
MYLIEYVTEIRIEDKPRRGMGWDTTREYSTSYCPVVAPLDRRILRDYSILGEDVDPD